MKIWQTFDVRKYIQDETLCNRLKEQEDMFSTIDLVDKFIDFVQLNTLNPNVTIGIISQSGNGKSFFLGLLYCRLQHEEKSVHFIDILDFIGDDAQICINKITKLADKECKTVNILIDNLDKHSSTFIYSFIYLLHRLTIKENFFFVLTYDYSTIAGKLSQITYDDKEIEHFLQSYIDIEFYLGGRIPIEYLHKSIDEELETLFEEVFNEKEAEVELKTNTNETLRILKYFLTIFIDKKNISIKQLNSSINKLKYIITQDIGISSIDIICYFNLLMLKVVDKKSYYALLVGSTTETDTIMDDIVEDDDLAFIYLSISQLTDMPSNLADYYRVLSKKIELVYE